VPAAVLLLLTPRSVPPAQRRVIVAFAVAASVWFGCMYLQIGMVLHPRYFLVPSVLLDILIAIAFIRLLRSGYARLAYAAAAFLVLTNCVGVYLDNRNPLFAERALRDYVKETGQVVLTDPETARRGEFLYEIAGVEGKITAGTPETGKPFFHNPRYVVWGMYAPGSLNDWLNKLAPYRPKPGWKEVWRQDSGHKLIGRVVAWIGLNRYLPEGIWRRLDSPSGTVIVYQP
jgi:hypothetical protein